MQPVRAVDTLSIDNCPNLPVSCTYLQQQAQNFSIEEQKRLVLDLLMNEYATPYHDFVESWNRDLRFASPPDGIVATSAETISDAWLETATAFPSVYSDTIFVFDKATVMTIYGYRLDMPPNYDVGFSYSCSDREPATGGRYSDCRTIYTSNRDATTLQIYNNGQVVGDKGFTLFNTSQNNYIESILTITNEIDMEHYKWQQGSCCREGCKIVKGKRVCTCIAWDYNCVFSGNDKRVDTLQLKDDLTAEREHTFPDFQPRLLLSYSADPQLASMTVPTRNVKSYVIKLKYQTLKKEFNVYSVNYTLPPQNVLYVVARQQKGWFTDNAKILSVDNQNEMETVTFETSKEGAEECTVTIQTYFNTTVKECAVERLNETALKLETDQWFYGTNETIMLTVKSNYNNVDIEYGNQKISLFVQGQATVNLTPELGASVIVASISGNLFEDEATTSAMINVSDNSELNLAFDVFLLMLVFYVLYKVAERYYREKKHA